MINRVLCGGRLSDWSGQPARGTWATVFDSAFPLIIEETSWVQGMFPERISAEGRRRRNHVDLGVFIEVERLGRPLELDQNDASVLFKGTDRARFCAFH